jgi:hypothetical protein
MARWLMLGLMIIGVVLIFTTKSAGVLMLGLFVGIIGFFGFITALAADRVSASSRPESAMAAMDDIAALRKRRAAPAPSAMPVSTPIAPRPTPAIPAATPARAVARPTPATVAGEMRMPDSSD